MADKGHAPGEACCGVCRDFAGREPPPRRDTPPLRLSPEEAVVRILEPRCKDWREVRPGKAEVVFGRSAQADIQINDTALGRRQSRLVFVDGGVEVEDLRSSCGTFLDGERVTRAVLREGSRIAFGNVTVQVTRAAPHSTAREDLSARA